MVVTGFRHCLLLPLLLVQLLLTGVCLAGDPFVFFDWEVSYITISPLGVKQQVALSLSLPFSLSGVCSCNMLGCCLSYDA